MNSAVQRLVRSITDKDSLSECSVNDLQQMAMRYPYSGPVQFLLARKLKDQGDPGYEEQSRKALLFFHNQLWYTCIAADAAYEGSLVQGVAPPAAIVEETELSEEAPAPAPSQPETSELVAEEQIMIPEKEELTAPAAEIPSGEEDPGTGEGPELPKFHFEPADTSAALTFEPYHTVDYFASQGIRSPETEKPKDKFSQQLKSFTEWLKAMKKLPEAGAGARPSSVDSGVDQMAASSLADREIITEAMAAVWEKQGNHEKAIETYHKLSLLDPAKSAYFASKIEHLKQL